MMVRNSQLFIFFALGMGLGLILTICFYKTHEKQKEKTLPKKENLVGQTSYKGDIIMTHEGIHTINGFRLYMTPASYRKHVEEVGDTVVVFGTQFQIIPKFNQDSLMCGMTMKGVKKLPNQYFNDFKDHMENVWKISYEGSSIHLPNKKKQNLELYFDTLYSVKSMVNMKGKDKLSVSLGVLSEDSLNKVKFRSTTVGPSKMTPVILFAETDAVEKTAEQRAKDRYRRDAQKFMRP